MTRGRPRAGAQTRQPSRVPFESTLTCPRKEVPAMAADPNHIDLTVYLEELLDSGLSGFAA